MSIPQKVEADHDVGRREPLAEQPGTTRGPIHWRTSPEKSRRENLSTVIGQHGGDFRLAHQQAVHQGAALVAAHGAAPVGLGYMKLDLVARHDRLTKPGLVDAREVN